MIENNKGDPTRLSPDISSIKKIAKYGGIHLSEKDELLLIVFTAQEQAVLRAAGAYVERAQNLGVPLGTLRSRLHRARAKLVELRKKADSTNSETPLD